MRAQILLLLAQLAGEDFHQWKLIPKFNWCKNIKGSKESGQRI